MTKKIITALLATVLCISNVACSNSTPNTLSATAKPSSSPVAPTTPPSEKIEYTATTAKDIHDAYNSNAMRFEQGMYGTYVEIAGIIDEITSTCVILDSGGLVWNKERQDYDGSIFGVPCIIQEASRENVASGYDVGDYITLYGKVVSSSGKGSVALYDFAIDECSTSMPIGWVLKGNFNQEWVDYIQDTINALTIEYSDAEVTALNMYISSLMDADVMTYTESEDGSFYIDSAYKFASQNGYMSYISHETTGEWSNYDVMTLDAINEVLEIMFGRTEMIKTVPSYFSSLIGTYDHSTHKLYVPMGDGEMETYFAQVLSIDDNGDNTYEIFFEIYEAYDGVEYDMYKPGVGLDDYRVSSDGTGNGTIIVRKTSRNGMEIYQCSDFYARYTYWSAME